MIATLAGNNSFGLQKRLKGLTSEFAKKYGDIGIEKIDALEAESAAIIEAVQAQPFLAERKMVVLANLSKTANPEDTFEQILSSISDSTDLIFYEPAIDRRTAFFKELKSKTQLEELAEIDPRNLGRWLVEQAKSLGGEISLADANYLAERLGANQYLLANELDKLITYQPKVSRQTIDALTEPNPQSRIFDLLDAAFSQNKDRALKLYDEQRAQKVEPQAILAMLAWQLRLLAYAKFGQNRSAAQIAKDIGSGEYPVRKAQALAAKIDESKLKSMVSEALDIDVKAKSTAIDLDEALKNYIISL